MSAPSRTSEDVGARGLQRGAVLAEQQRHAPSSEASRRSSTERSAHLWRRAHPATTTLRSATPCSQRGKTMARLDARRPRPRAARSPPSSGATVRRRRPSDDVARLRERDQLAGARRRHRPRRAPRGSPPAAPCGRRARPGARRRRASSRRRPLRDRDVGERACRAILKRCRPAADDDRPTEARLELRVRRLDALHDAERAFVHLYGDSPNAFWLDSSSGRRARPLLLHRRQRRPARRGHRLRRRRGRGPGASAAARSRSSASRSSTTSAARRAGLRRLCRRPAVRLRLRLRRLLRLRAEGGLRRRRRPPLADARRRLRLRRPPGRLRPPRAPHLRPLR